MAPEGSSREVPSGGKTDFITRFKVRYDEWKVRPVFEANDQAEKDRLETDCTVPDHEVFGFKNEMESMENFLLDQKVYKEFKSLVIVGEYGVGKTTLCKMIFNDAGVKSVYAPRIWVSMHTKETNQVEDKRISVLKRILKDLGVEDEVLQSIYRDAMDEAAHALEAGEISKTDTPKVIIPVLLYALHLNLRWKKYLIVFDDVREEDEWNEMLQDDAEKLKKEKKWGKYLSDGFPKGFGGRVIYTTRDENLVKKLVVEEHEIHHLWPLTDTESVWKIYKAALKENDNKEVPPKSIKKCIDELMNKSRGLPLAARMLATVVPPQDKSIPKGSSHGTTVSTNKD